ncbi:MAG: hypothetical protein AAGA48_10295 [Myxococcota bacterium]
MTALLLWLACGNPTSERTAGPESFTDPAAPWLGPDAAAPTDIEVSRVEASIELAFEALDELDPTPLVTAYSAVMAAGDTSCPSFFTADEGFDYWLDTCESPSGASFDGFGVLDVTEGVPVDFGLVGTTTTIGGSGSVVGPDGAGLDMNGFLQVTAAADASTSLSNLTISGSFATDHAAANGTWLEQGWEPEVSQLRLVVTGVGEVRVINGVIENLDLDGQRFPVVLQNVAIADVATGFTDCGIEPTGVISVRLDGDWVDVIFDPIQTDDGILTPSDVCDGCGEAWSGTQSLGPVCVAF